MEELFSEFEPVTFEDWEKEIFKSLKGKDYDSTLIWETDEDIVLRPYYRKQDLVSELSLPPRHKSGNLWAIRADIHFEDDASGNSDALKALNEGASAIGLIGNPTNLNQLLDQISIEHIGLYFECDDPQGVYEQLVAYCEEKDISINRLNLAFGLDPIGDLQLTGKWATDQATDLEKTVEFATSLHSTTCIRAITIRADHFHNAGGNMVQQLAGALGQAVEYMSLLTDNGCTPAQAAARIQFAFAAGSSYFMEIAKLRAFRLLWQRVLKAYEVQGAEAFVHSSTSMWRTSAIDPNTNMLRATSQAMSAIIGGADSLNILPYDSASRIESSDHAQRVALHCQHILQEEAGLHKVADPAAGAYYIEEITKALAGAGWSLFLRMESDGGYIKSLYNGWPQLEIKGNATNLQAAYEAGELVVIGANEYPNPMEKNRVDTTENTPPAPGDITPLHLFRITETTEYAS